jgi:hypothetical protein
LPLSFINTGILDLAHWIILRDPLEAPIFYLKITNASNQDVYISYGQNKSGVILAADLEDHDYILANSSLELNFQQNNLPNAHTALLAEGTTIFVRGAAGVGIVWASCLTSYSE